MRLKAGAAVIKKISKLEKIAITMCTTCISCSCKLFIFSTSQPKVRPHLEFNLS